MRVAAVTDLKRYFAHRHIRVKYEFLSVIQLFLFEIIGRRYPHIACENPVDVRVGVDAFFASSDTPSVKLTGSFIS